MSGGGTLFRRLLPEFFRFRNLSPALPSTPPPHQVPQSEHLDSRLHRVGSLRDLNL